MTRRTRWAILFAGGIAGGVVTYACIQRVTHSTQTAARYERGYDSPAPADLSAPARAGEELWVIARAPAPPRFTKQSHVAGEFFTIHHLTGFGDGGQPKGVESRPAPAPPPFPMLRAKRLNAAEEIPLPLAHTDVTASIAAYIASVHVSQEYHNPYAEKIEAVYVFPLPPDAAVNEFLMTIGDHHIRGIIREREEAERVYQEARQRGYVASLMTQERPNVFTQAVANIEPGKDIGIDLTYFNSLAYHDGEYEFVFPMVVGPRHNPPGITDGIGAVARGAAGISGQATEVQYLAPDERSGHDIGIAIDIDAAVAIESVTSPTHRIDTTPLSPTRTHVDLGHGDTLPNKDFVLRYKVAGDTTKGGMLVHRDQRGGFFTLMLQPPADLAALPRAPMEMVFVLDCSGSMHGYPIQKAKGTLTRALRRLEADDTFQVVRFSDSASQFGDQPVPATPENIERAIAYVAQLNSEGGTHMMDGIRAALDFPHDPRRLRIVSFMTDGYIGNEAQILDALTSRLGATRIFSIGIGASVNRYLLDAMARVGQGAVAYVTLDESTDRAVDQLYERATHAALTDIEMDWGGLTVTDVFPQRVPDLFVGQPVVLTGRFSGNEPTTITVRGNSGGRAQALTVTVDPNDAERHPALASMWARMKIADLEDAGDSTGTIKDLALAYGLMSAYTAFVAADSSAVTAGGPGTTVSQAVPMPEGVSYETTVQRAQQ